MVTWIIYVVVVTVFVSLAALAAEQAMRQRRRANRWVWLCAMAASLVLPTTLPLVPLQVSSFINSAAPQPLAALREATLMRNPGLRLALLEADDSSAANGTDFLLKNLWLAASATLLMALVMSGMLVQRRKRQWQAIMLCGTQVYVAPDVGPAVVGLLRPRIVVPGWLMSAPTLHQQMVMAHEHAHLKAYDPQLLSVALCLLVAMPWNLPLWWQLRRLRRAIEVDCDARVLRSGHNLSAYGETLLAVGQHQSGFTGVAAAMSEPTSFLEQRIRIMLKKPSVFSRIVAIVLACLSMGLVALAAEVSPPAHAQLDTELLQGFEGYYQSADQEVIQLTREGQHLFQQFTGRPQQEVWASSGNTLVDAKGDPASTATRDAQGLVTSMVMHRRTLNFTATRISEAQANKIADAVAAKIKKQVATPGTEAALRRLFAQTMMNPVKLDGIGPLMAAGMKEQSDELRPQFKKLGTVQSVNFKGVSETGADQYVMRFDHGSILWQIALENDGTISRVTFHPL
jgi:bla regulator protein BlaR1